MTNFGFQVWKSCFTGKPLHKLWREHSETARTDASYVLQYVVIITTFIRWHPIHMIWNHAKYSQWIRGLVSRQVHFWCFLQMSLLPYVAMTTWDQHPNRNETSGLRSTLKVVAVNLQPASRSAGAPWVKRSTGLPCSARVVLSSDGYPGIHIPSHSQMERQGATKSFSTTNRVGGDFRMTLRCTKDPEGSSVSPKAGTIQQVFA